MNRAFQSYSPRVRRFKYDSLLLDTGCQDLPPGYDYFLSQAFERICIFPHDNASLIFNQDDQVAYATGPATTGDPRPWSARWAAWVGRSGIRVDQTPYAEAGGTGGYVSNLFPKAKPTKLALGFTSIGQMAIAIQKNEDSIQIKWYKDGTGAIESIGDVSFVGESPVLFQNGLVATTDDEDENDLALYYIRVAEPRRLFARFEREHFTLEHIVNENIQTDLAALKSSEKVGSRQLLYARDAFGRDITFYSPVYVVLLDGDAMETSVGIESGEYRDTAVPAMIVGDAGTIDLAITSGLYHTPIESAGTLTGDTATLTPSFSAGEYI